MSIALSSYLVFVVPVDSRFHSFATPTVFLHVALTGVALLLLSRTPNLAKGFLLVTLLALLLEGLWFGLSLFIGLRTG